MMELFHSVSARSFRALWMLEELGLPYQLKMLPFPPRVMARSFLELNPLGTVPLLIDGDARLTESSAICTNTCAATRPAQRFPCSPVMRPTPAIWTGCSCRMRPCFPLTLVLRYTHFEPPERRQPQVVQDYARWFLGRLKAVEAATSQREYPVRRSFHRRRHRSQLRADAVRVSRHARAMGTCDSGLLAAAARAPAFQRSLEIEKQAAIDQGVDPMPSPLLRP